VRQRNLWLVRDELEVRQRNLWLVRDMCLLIRTIHVISNATRLPRKETNLVSDLLYRPIAVIFEEKKVSISDRVKFIDLRY